MCLMCVDKSADEIDKVLVIDDEPSVADALRLILEYQGFSVVVASTGREGIEHARRGTFSVTITDLRLPDMNGLEVIDECSRGGLGGRIILTTSYGTPEIVERAHALGIAGFISKPFLPSDILRLVAASLEGDASCADRD